jgi:hypothetical protein
MSSSDTSSHSSDTSSHSHHSSHTSYSPDWAAGQNNLPVNQADPSPYTNYGNYRYVDSGGSMSLRGAVIRMVITALPVLIIALVIAFR